MTLLGEGAMGEVYRARDTRLGRDVAVKILPDRLAQDPEALGRFEREARAIAALSHANVLAIYDVGKAFGVSYSVTELLEGDTLRRRIGGQALPRTIALDYALQIARGLAAVHDRGIVHRDLKPENIIVTTGEVVKILDFGLAKGGNLLAADGDAPTEYGSTAGRFVGTLGYASPEQLRGHAVDHRADIFAFGAILYELLFGVEAFGAASPAETISAVLNDTPILLSRTHAGIPVMLRDEIGRCLDKTTDGRPSSMRQVITTIEAAQRQTDQVAMRPAFESPSAQSVAVLPFSDMSPGKDQDYFCEGIAEEIINALASLENLRVAARTSAFQFKGQAKDIRDMAKALNVQTVLEGSVRVAGRKLRIAVQLINAADGYHLWSGRFDRDLEDVFAVQDEIAQTVAQTLKVTLGTPASNTAGTPQTANVEAYTLYLKGRHQWNTRTAQGLQKSIEHYQEALVIDPQYARAWAALADTYVSLCIGALREPAEVMPRARHAAERAIEISPRLAEAHVSLGCVDALYDWAWATAERHLTRAIALEPTYAAAHHAYAMNYLIPLGRFAEARLAQARALALDPLSLVENTSVGVASYYAGAFEQAVREFHAAIDLDAGAWLPRHFLGLAYAELGQFDEARYGLDEAIRLSGRHPEALAAIGYVCGLEGDRLQATKLLEEMTALATGRYVSPTLLAQVWTSLEEPSRAMDCLERALDGRATSLAWLRVRPTFTSLHGDPRFTALLNRLNLTGNDRPLM